MHAPLAIALFGLTLAGPLIAGPTVWLDERFADGERLTQKPPASAEWFSSSAMSTLSVQPGALTQDGGGRHVLAYFGPATLAPGESLVLTYEIILASPSDAPGALRVGLFNSDGKHVASDKQARSGDFTGYRGYMAATNPAPSKNPPLRLFKRTQGDDTLIAAVPSFLPIGEPAGIVQALQDGETHTGTFMIRHSTSGQAALSCGFSGGRLAPHEVTTTDFNSPVTTFDTVVFHIGTKAARAFTLKSVRIETRTP
ncbi:MAG: hypothetical protein K0R17_187 [Rariglobus sp.]|jgi:hypothetical protein|nr:hypothetical protein [Rariglobus sp.]